VVEADIGSEEVLTYFYVVFFRALSSLICSSDGGISPMTFSAVKRE